MPASALIFELVLRGIAIGALGASAVGFVRGASNPSMRFAGALFCVSVIAYVLNSSPVLRIAIGPLEVPALLLSLGGAGYFWLFIVTLFGDRRLAWELFVPAAILTLVGFVGLVTEPPVRNGVWIVHNILELALAAHALYVIYTSWHGDLVEARRRLRVPFLGLVTFYVIVLSGIEIGESVGVYASWYSLAGAATLAFFCLAGCVMFLEARASLFGAPEPAAATPAAPRIDPADRITLEKLAEAMDKGAAWKDESLTIGTLAEKVGVPEHRLRRLINDNLGHRNFAAFVNTRRIEAAKALLADPAQSRTTVAAVAFDLGFGSLGPFNRAFKEATGQTPTQWRREALEKASPNPEISG
jgi:AraC-like DNA-binding protein